VLGLAFGITPDAGTGRDLLQDAEELVIVHDAKLIRGPPGEQRAGAPGQRFTPCNPGEMHRRSDPSGHQGRIR
jgi:hypothetical protein